MKLDIGQIIKEELYNSLNEIKKLSYLSILMEDYNMNFNYMNLNDLSKILAEKYGEGEPAYVDIFMEILQGEYKKGGDNAVINFIKERLGIEVYLVRNGRYSFNPQVTPSDYEKRL